MKNLFAVSTTVSPEKSRAEIEQALLRHGADTFGYAWTGDQAVISFRIRGTPVRLSLPLPSADDPAFTQRRGRTAAQGAKGWEQAVRQRWRILLLIVKAKLEVIAAGVSTLEREFLPDVCLPDGRTVGEWLVQLTAEGVMPTPLCLANRPWAPDDV